LWNSITNPNGYCDGDPYSDGDRDGHTDRNCNGHPNSYSYAKTHSNPETPSHTKTPSDPTAPSVTGNTRLEQSQESRNAGIEERDFRDRRQNCEGSSERERELSEFQHSQKTSVFREGGFLIS
jgi:hypothetical protein